jgi:hypothetical protein
MFLHNLSQAQKEAFLSLARAFMETDTKVTGEEEQMLSLMKREMGLAPDAAGMAGSRSEWLALFDSRPSQAAVLLEIIGLGHADSEFSTAESAFVQEIADAFGIDHAELLAMENWVVRQVALAREAAAFFSEEGR